MGRDSSVIFIDSSNYATFEPYKSSWVFYFRVPPRDLFYRIVTSLVPPVGNQFRHIYVDLLGPSLALLFMAAILHYGYAYKVLSAQTSTSPTEILLIYTCLMPCLSYLLSKIGKSKIGFLETVSLLGYSMYGHVFTLCLSLFCYQETSNTFFFVCFLIFGGLSALRVALVLLASIPLSAARLIVCSLITTVHLLFLIFVHFTYMHRTFVYGSAESLNFDGK